MYSHNRKLKIQFLFTNFFVIFAILSCGFESNSDLAEDKIANKTPLTISTETPTATLVYTPTPIGTPTLGLNSLWRNSRIAFSSNRSGNYQIYLMRPDGSELKQLTDSIGDNQSPAWSQDGKKIAFVSTRDGNSEIYVMNPDGSEQVNVSKNISDDYLPVWLPKNRILFVSKRSGQEIMYVTDLDGTKVETIHGTKLSTAAKFFCINWLGDGLISYTFEEDSQRQVRLMDVRDYRISVHDFLEGETPRACPLWSPTSGTNPWMMFVSDRGGEDELYKYNFNTEEELQVTFNSLGSLGAARSMNAASDDWIVFYSKQTTNWDIFVARINGLGDHGQWNITNNSADDIQPAWEPY